MIYSVKDYYQAALIHYSSVEATNGATITRRNRHITRLEWAHFLTEGRRKVVAEILRRNDRLLARELEETTYPAVDYVVLDPPGSFLKKMVRAISLVEWYTGLQWVPIDAEEDWERYRYEFMAQIISSRWVTPKWNLDGPRFRLLPKQEARLRFTYLPELDRIEVGDLPDEDGAGGDESHDYSVPGAVQHAVPIWAAYLAASRDRAMQARADLQGLWASALEDIETLSHTRQSASPEYAIYTRDGVP